MFRFIKYAYSIRDLLLGKIKMTSPEDAGKAFVGAASRARTGYIAGVRANTDAIANAKSDAAETAYNDKMQDVLAEKRRQSGLKDVTQTDWQEKSERKGAPALSTGIANAGPDFRKGYQDVNVKALDGQETPKKDPTDPVGNATRAAEFIAKRLVNASRAKRGLPEI